MYVLAKGQTDPKPSKAKLYSITSNTENLGTNPQISK